MGTGDEDTAAVQLRLLDQNFRQHPVTGPEGHSFVSSAPRSTPTSPGIPYDTDVVDHIRACVSEIATEVLAVNPRPGPLPKRVGAVYDWFLDNTKTADHAQRQRRAAIIYRQQLEHAIALGEAKVIRRHRCPQCRTMGLFWKPALKRALCTNARCLTDEGTSNTWTLAHLAYTHIAERENHGRVSAT
jgi:hypothetical protein